eukprot:CAMPEP_0172156696 /NCGR_PEP_ID=MMETSP1050-20130122/3366_1 /TAXON_ID=233186 /ORGANISM="Cryptomonas curvata, Strain CCAP979/52" /LENGTH=144 /DNA_ID=CAMNT_0012825817 /DNA_START=461 /DNA_END=891 /DNA_ORIENTATION=-
MEIGRDTDESTDSTSSFRCIRSSEWLNDMQDGATKNVGNDARGGSPRPAQHTDIYRIAASFSNATSLRCDDKCKQEPVGGAGNDAPDSAQMLKALASIRACKTRAILTDEQAIRIYQIKLDNQTACTPGSSSARILNFRAGNVA